MNVLHAVLREDFGRLDPASIRAGLLAEAGIHDVCCETARNRLRIEYDPATLDRLKLVDIMCRHALFPAPPAADERD
jgi:hypothetical protein